MARRISVEIVGDSRSLERAFKRSASSAQKFEQGVGKAGKQAGRHRGIFHGLGKAAGLAGGAIGISGLAGAARASFDEMADAQKVTAQTNAVLKSTHGAAGVTAKQVDKLAGSLLNLSGKDDEAIKSGENLLLTFTSIQNQAGKGNQIFDRATRTMLDMSVALGQPVKSSALQLGKALNDPIKGVTSLRRVGVQFTAQQQKQIKTMTEHGNKLGAQKLILGELNREFGGSAAAAGKTLPGQFEKLQNQALNLGGTLAQSLVPSLTKFVTAITAWMSKGKNQQTVLDTLKTGLTIVTHAVRVLRTAFHWLSVAVGGNKNAIKFLIGAYAGFKILQIAGRINTLRASLWGSKRGADAMKGASRGLRGSLVGKAGLAAGVFAAGYELSKLIRRIPGWDKAMRNFGGTIYDVFAKVGLVHDPMKQFRGKIVPGQQLSGAIRQQAARLERRGLTPQQAAQQISRQRPGMALRDIQVLAGVFGRAPTVRASAAAVGRAGVTINMHNVHLPGIHNPRQFEDHMRRRSKKRPHTRH